MRPPTILVVDDEPVVRNLIVTVLVREDYRVLEAANAAEALHVCDTFKGQIDLVIADHTLKTMTGREVAERIVDSRPGVKILLISGYPRTTVEDQDGLLPGAAFLPKPFFPKDLTQKIRDLLG